MLRLGPERIKSPLGVSLGLPSLDARFLIDLPEKRSLDSSGKREVLALSVRSNPWDK